MLPLATTVFFLCFFATTSTKTTEITAESACEVCACVSGSSGNPKAVVSCTQPFDVISVVSIPTFVSKLIIGAGAARGTKVAFQRSGVRIGNRNNEFAIFVANVDTVEFEEKSVVSSGTSETSFDLSLEDVDSVRVDSGAFDVLRQVRFDRVGVLRLAPSSLKPNHRRHLVAHAANFDLSVRNSWVPTLPSDLFPPAVANVDFVHCNVSDVDGNAFSGFRMLSVRFANTTIDRFHRAAFPDKTLIDTLEFDGCSLASLSPKAITSAMTVLSIQQTVVRSIGHHAINAPVATIRIINNTFNTVGSGSLSFRSWSRLHLEGNDFRFVDSNAFSGLSESEFSSSFTFINNRIHYINQNGLLFNSNNLADGNVSGNVFHKTCDCQFGTWLEVVTGSINGWFAKAIRNTSLCRVITGIEECFDDEPFIGIDAFHEVACSHDDQGCSSRMSWIGNLFRNHIQVETNKGLLLVILLFALASSLFVGILTFIRWIIFTIRNGDKSDPNEWNFITKVERRNSSSVVSQYESLPMLTSTTIKSSQMPNEVSVQPDVVVPEQKTFYDEMLCLLKEKLDDPDSYATVVDVNGGNSSEETRHLLYQDPLDLASKSVTEES